MGARDGKEEGRGRGSSGERLKEQTVSACCAHLRGHMPQNNCVDGRLMNSLPFCFILWIFIHNTVVAIQTVVILSPMHTALSYATWCTCY